jgi:hypothetical protein
MNKQSTPHPSASRDSLHENAISRTHLALLAAIASVALLHALLST